MKKSILLFFSFNFIINANAQWGNFGNTIKNQINNKTQQKIQEEIDNAYDKTYDNAKKDVKGEGKQNNNNKQNNSTQQENNNSNNAGSNNNNQNNASTNNQNSKLSATSKFDFVPGEKVIVIEDFMQDEIGDFPSKWNTNSSGEIVTVSGQSGRWFKLSSSGSFLPEFITQLPENFTFEFDLACTQPFSYYSTAFNVAFVDMLKPSIDFMKWHQYKHGKNGVTVGLHPQDAGNNSGRTNYSVRLDEQEIMKNEIAQSSFFHKNKPIVHVSIWRQKGRLRVYINQEKVWDLPKAFVAPKYNGIVFWVYDYNSNTDDAYYISNLKLAVGAPDTRNKLITEGKFSTSGILFDINSDKIKVESHGVIKSIADILNENPDIKIKVIGHTDSDGDDTKNLDLSKKRAISVKNYLTSVFGIEASRIETDGKGETQPIDNNTTKEGKTNNRRVEFIKL